MVLIKVGDVAPDFTLLDQDGKNVSLSDFKERNVVIYFYPRALTPGCTTQACAIRDIKKEFDELNTVVLGISPDSSKKLLNFVNKKDLNFVLLSDEDHKVAVIYGVWGLKKFMGREYMGINRITFVVGGDGVVKFVMDKVNTKTHHDDVLKLLRSLG